MSSQGSTCSIFRSYTRYTVCPKASAEIKADVTGPIIRITPDELHVNDVGFLDSVYAPSSKRRDKYEYQLKTLRVPGGVGTTASYDVHKKRREALSPFFSKRNVVYLEPLIAEKVEQLCQIVAKHAAEKTPVNLSDIFNAFSNEYDYPLARRLTDY